MNRCTKHRKIRDELATHNLELKQSGLLNQFIIYGVQIQKSNSSNKTAIQTDFSYLYTRNILCKGLYN